MYILKARNRNTCKDDLISRFADKRLFDSEISKVDPEKYSDAMIKEEDKEGYLKYVILKKPTQKVLTKTISHSRS